MKMKRIFVKVFCAVLALATMATFVSCGKKYDVIYISNEKGETVDGFNENMLSFHMSMEKTTTLVSLGSTQDVPELWNMKVSDYVAMLGMETADSIGNNMTFGEYYTDYALKSAKQIVAASYLYDTMKGTDTVAGKLLAESDKKLEPSVDKTVSDLQLSIGSKENFEAFISGLGITLEDFRIYYGMNYKFGELRKVVDVSEDEKKDYFEKNYAIVKHILINTESKTNDAGEKVSLTAEEKNAKLAEVKAAEARIAAGEDYEVVFAEYDGTDPGTQYYTEGYFVTDNGKFMPEFQDAALDMKDGEVRTVYTSYGAHIMKKYPMDPEKYKLYSDIYSEITSVLANKAFADLINPYVDKVTVNSEVTAKYSIATVPMMDPSAV